MEWIKCSDRMPQPNVPVLIFQPGLGYIDVAWLHPWESPRDGKRHDYFTNDDREYRGVTHWMPTPDGPAV